MAKKSATLTDIAEELDIDVSTVSKAMKDHPKISDKTKQRVKQVARELNYKPNYIATALVKGQSNLIGVMVPHTDETFFASAIRGMEEVAKQNNYQIIIFQSHDEPAGEKDNLEAMYRTKVDGIIASPGMNTTDFSHYKDVMQQDLPLVIFDRYTDAVNSDVVGIDDFKASYEAVEHLIEQGYKKIAHISGYRHVHIYDERARGYLKALADHQLPFEDDLMVESNASLQEGQKVTEKLLDKHPDLDAIFTSSDNTALGAIQILKKKGISVPEECAVVGFSNNEFSSYVTPTITSIEQHSRKMGKIAIQLLLDRITSPEETLDTRPSQKTILSPELIIRESSSRK